MVAFGDYLERAGQEHAAQTVGINYNMLKTALARSVPHANVVAAPGAPPAAPEASPFIPLLEEEMARVHGVVRDKLRLLHRAKKAIRLCHQVQARSTSNAQDRGITLLQLANVYEEVVMMLWFMTVNAIAVSKIVKKYNKNYPAAKYSPDLKCAIFLRTGPLLAQKAKSSIEQEFASLIEVEPSASEQLLLSRNATVSSMATRWRELADSQAKHLYAAPTEGVVAPAPQPHPKRRVSRSGSIGCGDGSASAPQLPWSADLAELHARFEVLSVAGSGAYGVVHKARCRDTRAVVALKTVHNPWSHPVLSQRTYREIQIMQQLSHPNILQLLDVLAVDDSVHLVMPYVAHTCAELLTSRRLMMVHKKWFILQLLSALAYLHGRGAVHRDIKLSNILVDDTPKVYLTDFGLSRTVGKAEDDASSRDEGPDYVQTQWYRAPEVLRCVRGHAGSDMWSTGCVMGEMLTGVPIFPGQNDAHQLELIRATVCCGSADAGVLTAKRPLEEVVEGCWRMGQEADFELEPALSLMRLMLQYDAGDRISAQAAMAHPWFAEEGFPPSAVAELNRAAVGLWEEPVKLGLSCTRLHELSQYKGAVQRNQNIPLFRKKLVVQADMNEAAEIIQKAWRWKTQGGERPDLETISLSRRRRGLKYCGCSILTSQQARKRAACGSHNHSYNHSYGSGSKVHGRARLQRSDTSDTRCALQSCTVS